MRLRRPVSLRKAAELHRPQKTEHLIDIYEPYFTSLRGEPVSLFEIGVKDGSSLRMWRTYFRDGQIFGLDIKEKSRKHEEERVRIFIGDQKDPVLLDQVADEGGPFDIVLDDGSHQAEDQQQTLRHLWPHVKPGGFYVMEDVHTSYKPGGRWEMGWRVAGTTMEFIKGLLDDVHAADHGQPQVLEDLEFVHLYYRTVVLRKLSSSRADQEAGGKQTWYRAR